MFRGKDNEGMGKPGNTRSKPHRTGPKAIASMEKTVRILERRAALWTLADIAKEEGISDRAVAKRIEKAIHNAPIEPVNRLRETLSEQVRYAMRAVTEKVNQGNLQAIDRWFAGIERLSRLYGVDLTPTLIIEKPLPANTLAMLDALANIGNPRLLDAVEGEARTIEEGEENDLQRQREAEGGSERANEEDEG